MRFMRRPRSAEGLALQESDVRLAVQQRNVRLALLQRDERLAFEQRERSASFSGERLSRERHAFLHLVHGTALTPIFVLDVRADRPPLFLQ